MISKTPEISGAYLPHMDPKMLWPIDLPNISRAILKINVHITVIDTLMPVILAASPVPKLFNIKPRDTTNASLIFKVPELSESDFSA